MNDLDDKVNKAAEVVANLGSFGHLLPIRTKSGGFNDFGRNTWHDEQKTFDDNRTGRDIVLKARQVGMTTLELARDVQHLLMNEGTQTLIVTQDGDLAEQKFIDAQLMVAELIRLDLCPKPKYSTKREIVLPHNGSALRIVEAGNTEASAAKKGRSGTIHRLHATELAFWGAAQETMVALMAAVPDDGQVVIESTANGAQGLFYEMVTTALAGGGDFKLHFFPWHAHRTYRRTVPADFDPRPQNKIEEQLREAGVDDEQIAWWRALLSDPARGGIEKVLQEYPVDPSSCFRSPGRSFFPSDAMDVIAKHVREPVAIVPIDVPLSEGGPARLLGHLRVWEEPQQGRTYFAAADVSEGTGLDRSTVVVLDAASSKVVASFATADLEPGDLGLALAWVGRRYDGAMVAPERNNHGHACIRELTHGQTPFTPYGNIYVGEDDKLGWPTTTGTRPVMFDDLYRAVTEASLTVPDAELVGELRTIVRGKDGKPAAINKGSKGGAKDDLVMALAIAWQLKQRVGVTWSNSFEFPRSQAQRLGGLL